MGFAACHAVIATTSTQLLLRWAPTGSGGGVTEAIWSERRQPTSARGTL